MERVGPESHKLATYTVEHRLQNTETHVHKTTYGPLIITALYVMLLMLAKLLLGQVGGGWALA